MKVRGVVKGKTIVLDEAIEPLDGKVVEVEVRDVKEPVSKRNGPSENEDDGTFDTNKLVNELREELGI